MNVVRQQRKEVRKSLREDPNNGIFRKAIQMAGENLEKVRKTAVLSLFCAHVCKLEVSVREGAHGEARPQLAVYQRRTGQYVERR